MRGINRKHAVRGIENTGEAYGLLAGLAVLLLAAAALNASCAHNASKLDTFVDVSARYDAALELTVTCVQPDGKRISWAGSGVIVSETMLLTAGHVAETEPGELCVYVAEDAAGNLYAVQPRVVLPSGSVDLASMELIAPSAKFKAAPVRFGAVPLLNEIVCSATAYPRREHKCGPVMKPKEPPGDIRMNMVVEPGNSGSGLYNMRGELVGIVVHTYPNRGNGQYITGGATSLAGHLKELFP